ncbi:MAG TPA: hypothetical protein VGD31_11460 [Sphingobacteriaceae bacterium]
MKHVQADQILKQMNSYQVSEFFNRLQEETVESVCPLIKKDEVLEFEHYMTIEGRDGNKDLHLRAVANYRQTQNLTRRVKRITVYESLEEMELYMSISEYTNEMSEDNELNFIFN